MQEIEIVWSGQRHSFKLEDGEHGVGRASDCEVQVPVPRVSKRHATLRVDGDRLFVRDLGSSNGTEVNGQPVVGAEIEIPRGAIVSFAGALMRLAGDGTPSGHSLVGDKHVTTRLRYRMDQGFSMAARDRIVDNSSKLFELLASGESSENVGLAACRFVSGCVSAERVVLLEDEGEGTTLITRAQWAMGSRPDAPLQLSSSIVGSVIDGRESILVADPSRDPRFVAQQSVMALNLRSAMAAPLFDNERVRGILYVDTTNAATTYTRDDLEVLAAAANAVAVKLRNISYEREMKTAAQIQRSMLPQRFDAPAGYELDAYQVMCRSVGGDLYTVRTRADGQLMLSLGDVSGKGMPAALAMGAATVLIGLLSEIDMDLGKQVELLHRQLYRSLTPEQFLTLFIGELDPTTGRLRYVNAGHEPPLVVHPDGTIDALDSTGLPVAMIEEVMLAVAEYTLAPGDLIMVFSDGIPEATTNGDRFLGLEPVRDVLIQQKGAPLSDIRKSVVKCVSDFLKGAPASDDVTMMLLRRSPEGSG